GGVRKGLAYGVFLCVHSDYSQSLLAVLAWVCPSDLGIRDFEDGLQGQSARLEHHAPLTGCADESDSRSAMKRSTTLAERSSSVSDSPTMREARSVARVPTSERS